MPNWIEKLLSLGLYKDGVPVPGALSPVLGRGKSRAGEWYRSPKAFAPKFDMLWVAQLFVDLKVYGFRGDRAVSGPDSHPAVTITLPDPEPGATNPVKVSALGFAPNGDMWVGYGESNQASVSNGRKISKVSASKLLMSGSIAPDFSFALPFGTASSSAVSAITVRPSGDLWLSTIALNNRSAGIFCYSAASIAAPGSPSPSVVLAQPFPPVPDNAQHTNAANDLYFDGAGNLWVTNAVARTVYRLSASQLLATNTAIVPDVVLTLGVAYNGVTVDGAGNLWCSAVGSVAMFAASDITVSGSPTPIRVINTATGATRVRFDAAGNLWNLAPTGPNGYAPIDVGSPGTPAPRCSLTGGGDITAGRMFAFNPQSFAQ